MKGYRLNCKQCNKIFFANTQNRIFCSVKCYGIFNRGRPAWNKGKKSLHKSSRAGRSNIEFYGIEKANIIKKRQSEARRGIPNPDRQTGKNIQCKICEKEFYIIPSLIGQKKTCSKECYSLWKSEQAKKLGYGKWMVGRKLLKESIIKREETKRMNRKVPGYISKQIGRPAWNKGKKLSKEEYPKFGWRTSRKHQVFPMKDSSIEVKMQNILDELCIEFITHEYIYIEHGYQCDIFIPSLNLVIECDGDYWHNRPYGREIDVIRSNELIASGYKLLRFWESEIKVMDKNDLLLKLNKIII